MGQARQLVREAWMLVFQYVSGLVGGFLGFLLAVRGAGAVLSSPNAWGAVGVCVGWPAGNLVGILLTDRSTNRKGWKRVLGIVAAIFAYVPTVLLAGMYWPLAAPLLMIVGYRIGFWAWKYLVRVLVAS